MKRYAFILGTLLCLSAMTSVKAAPVNIFDGKPVFAEGEARSYYVKLVTVPLLLSCCVKDSATSSHRRA